MADTIRNSFYEYYAFGLKTVGPNWTGLSNYTSLLSSDLPKYAWTAVYGQSTPPPTSQG